MSTITLPTGRVSTPRRAMASQTRSPARCSIPNGSRVRQSLTNSTPATSPTWRMSPTCGCGHSCRSSALSACARFCRARRTLDVPQQAHAGQSRGRPDLVCGETVSVEEGFKIFVLSQKSVENGLCCQRGSQGHVAAAQSFGQGQEVGLNTFVVRGEQRWRRGAGAKLLAGRRTLILSAHYFPKPFDRIRSLPHRRSAKCAERGRFRKPAPATQPAAQSSRPPLASTVQTQTRRRVFLDAFASRISFRLARRIPSGICGIVARRRAQAWRD